MSSGSIFESDVAIMGGLVKLAPRCHIGWKSNYSFSPNLSWWDLVSAHRDVYHLSMVCTWVAPAVFCTFRFSGVWCCT